MSQPVLVQVRAVDFAFTIGLHVNQAPVSSAYFLNDLDGGVLDGTAIFRIVTLQNQSDTVPAKIEVMQMGKRVMDPGIPVVLKHESTEESGLRHLQGTVSLARFAPGAVYHSFFVCMRDEPSLDYGGARNPDGQGFAAFGYVADGFEHLQRVFHAHAATRVPEYLESPILLKTFRRGDRPVAATLE